MADAAILGPAMSKINVEDLIAKPLKFRMSFELALAESESEVENAKTLSQYKQLQERARTAEADAIKSFSRKGGRVRKADALTRLIRGIVSDNPTITTQQLLIQLKRLVGQGTIYSIDTAIHFYKKDEELTTAPVSGLKDRLARAKQKIHSR